MQRRIAMLTAEANNAMAGSAQNQQAFQNMESLVEDLSLQNKNLSSPNFDLKH